MILSAYIVRNGSMSATLSAYNFIMNMTKKSNSLKNMTSG